MLNTFALLSHSFVVLSSGLYLWLQHIVRGEIFQRAITYPPSPSIVNVDFLLLLIRSVMCQVMKISAIGVEVRTAKGSLHWCLDFRDMDSPGIILLCDAYGRKALEGGGFVLCPLYGRKCKAFIAASGASNSSVLTKLVGPFPSCLSPFLTLWQ